MGGTRRVTVSLSPSNAFNKNVRWQSSDTSVVSIKSNKDEGTTAYAELQGNKIGSATVTAITTDGSNRTYNFYINVQYDYSNIPVTGITVSKSSVALKVDGIESVYASVTPSNATKKGVSWKSSNSNVVTVFANGNNATVRGNSEGAAYVIATSDDGSFAGYIYVQVSKNTQDVKGVSLNKTYTELYVNGYETLISTILPPNASNTQVDWKSSNSNVASVSNSGFIRANAVGDAVITVTTRDGNYSASCYVRVSENSNTQISGVQLSKHSLSMSLNSKDYLYATVSPYGSNQSVNWVSSNESVVKVSSSGELTAVGTGKAYITVMTKTGGYVDVCEVTVGDTTGVNAVSSSLSFNSEVYQASDKTWILNLWIQIDNLVIDAKTVQDYLNLGGMSLYSNVSYNSPGLYQAWIKVPAQKGNYNVSLNGNSLWKYSTTSIEIR
ncbi:Bacterial Ig-like domain (group 2) [compost metagenome]